MMANDYSLYANWSNECLKKHSGCTIDLFSDDNCHSECNNADCEYQLGKCPSSPSLFPSPKDCELYNDQSKDDCIKCNSSTYQLYISCVDACPSGYTSTLVFDTVNLCVPEEDETSDENPDQIFISSRENSLEYGDLTEPYLSLSVGLAHIRKMYTVVYLLKGEHNLITLDDDDEDTILSGKFSPLDTDNAIMPEVIKISPAFCEEFPSFECVPIGEMGVISLYKDVIRLDAFARLEFYNIKFVGKQNLLSTECTDCTFAYYCPNFEIDELSGDLQNDRGETITYVYAEKAKCEKNNEKSFLKIHSGATVYIENCDFIDWRNELKSVIYNDGGSLEMINTNFRNIRVASSDQAAVIYSMDCTSTDSNYSCGSISYSHGVVSLLNNGYEYDTTLSFSGFLAGKGLRNVKIQNVKFEDNLVYIGEESDSVSNRALGALIYVESFRQVSFTDCIFSRNFVDKGLVSLKMDEKLDDVLVSDSSSELVDHGLIHISFINTSFSDSIGTSNSGIYIIFQNEMMNLYLEDLTFIRSACINGSVLSVSLISAFKSEWITGIQRPVVINSIRINANFPKRTVTFKTISFEDCLGADNGIIYLNSLPNVFLNSLSLSKNSYLSSRNYLNEFILDSLIANTDSYIEITPKVSLTISKSDKMLGSIHSLYNTNITNLSIKNNQNVIGLTMDNLQTSFKASNLIISNNTLNTSNTIGLSISLNCTGFLKNISSYSNSNEHSSGFGSVKVSGITAFIEDSEFRSNSAAYGGGLVLYEIEAATVNKVIFIGNTLTGIKGGALYYEQKASALSYLTIKDSKFVGNTAKIGVGAAIALNNLISTSNTIKLDISSTEFTDGSSSSDSSAIDIPPSIDLKDSIIESCIFKNNKSTNRAGIFLAYSSGILTIQNSSFSFNTGQLGTAIYCITAKNTAEVPTKLIIKNSSFIQNEGSSVIHLADTAIFSHVETYSCEFKFNTGHTFMLEYAYWKDSASVFTNNTADTAPVAAISSYSQILLIDAEISLNHSKTNGGAFAASSSSSVSCISCIISYNSAAQNGGVFFIEQMGTVSLNNCTIYQNTSLYKGSVLFLIGATQTSSSISLSKLYKNSSNKGSVISLINSYMEISSSEIYENTSSSTSPGIILNLSTLVIHNSYFHNHYGSQGGFIYATTESICNITDSQFRYGEVTGSGGAVFLISSVLNAVKTEFVDMKAELAGTFLVYSESSLNLDQCIIMNSHAGEAGGGIRAFESTVNLYRTEIKNYTNGGIEADKLYKLYVSGSQFKDGSAENGAAIHCIRCKSVEIDDSKFINQVATTGGSLHLSTTSDIVLDSIYVISNCTFLNNTSLNGGAIYTDNIQLELLGSTFISNSARGIDSEDTQIQYGKGGALLLHCSDAQNCSFKIVRNHFQYNSAQNNGGAICWEDVFPVALANDYLNNSAIYGPDIASYPVTIGLLQDDGSILMPFDIRKLTESDVVHITTLNEIPSGQESVSLDLQFVLLDHKNQIVATDSYSTGEIVPNNTASTSITGDSKTISQSGIFHFSSFKISAEPGTSTDIKFTTSAIDLSKSSKSNDGISYISTVHLLINLRECTLGESLVGKECVVCTSGKYSLDYELPCQDCPSEAICYGGYSMVPRNGYWRPSAVTDVFFKCLNEYACVGSPAPPANLFMIGECALGYKGNLCQSCEMNYSRTSKNTCGRCPEAVSNSFRLLGILLGLVLVCAIMVRTSMRSAYKPTALHSVYIKIFMNYLQLIILTASFNLEWPQLVLELFKIQEATGTVTDQVFSFDCFLEKESSGNHNKDVYYNKLIIMSVVPIIIAFISFIFWIIIACYYKNIKYLTDELITTIVILLFLAHPNLVKVMFGAFSCKEITPNEYWLIDDLDIPCWDNDHIKYVTAIALPSIIVWGLGIPTISLYALFRNRKKLETIRVRVNLGFLFNGYNLKHFYWEFIILYRKILIICCSVFLGNISIPVQALTVLMILIASLYLQAQNHPYINPELNNMEMRSITVATATIYCGMYFLTEDLDSSSKLFFFIAILIANVYFMYHWITKMFSAGIELLRSKIPCCKKRFSGKVIDGFREDINVANNPVTNVKSNGQDRLISLLPYDHIHRDTLHAENSRYLIKYTDTMKNVYMNVVEQNLHETFEEEKEVEYDIKVDSLNSYDQNDTR